MTVERFLTLTQCCIDLGHGYRYQVIRPRVRCKDGYTVSIQASSGAYCNPRVDEPSNGYKSVELGYPSQKDELILPYAESDDNPTGTVYGYVPMQVVHQLCNDHGGIIDADLSNMHLIDRTKQELAMLDDLLKELRKESFHF